MDENKVCLSALKLWDGRTLFCCVYNRWITYYGSVCRFFEISSSNIFNKMNAIDESIVITI